MLELQRINPKSGENNTREPCTLKYLSNYINRLSLKILIMNKEKHPNKNTT
jgi:hypothetical protein